MESIESSNVGGNPARLTGRVIRKERGGCTVRAGDQNYLCTTRTGGERPSRGHPRNNGRRRHGKKGCSPAADGLDMVAVGDLVEFVPTAHGRGSILAVAPRRNRLSRRAAGPRPVEQVIASNIDQLVAVFAAAHPAPSWAMLDRYLVIAEANGMAATICITKTDLAEMGHVDDALRHYERLGYPVRRACCPGNEGLDALRDDLRSRCSVLVGKSGVGKSTLLNALLPDLALRIGEISHRTGKGRHTTTHIELFPLDCGGSVIDTPGVRELGLWGIADADLARHFREMRPLLGSCRFGACTHVHEPGCAVRQAVADGSIHSMRYESYLRMRRAAPAGIKHEADAERQPAPAPAGFECVHCGWMVATSADGTQHRNHCPQCLWSAHVDVRPGDRSAACGGGMEPIAVWARATGEWAVVHRCTDCGSVRTNRIAGDDNVMALMSLAAKALAQPPFPLDRLTAREVG